MLRNTVCMRASDRHDAFASIRHGIALQDALSRNTKRSNDMRSSSRFGMSQVACAKPFPLHGGISGGEYCSIDFDPSILTCSCLTPTIGAHVEALAVLGGRHEASRLSMPARAACITCIGSVHLTKQFNLTRRAWCGSRPLLLQA